ncbi:MAG: FAA hydrolase family protein [Candidatus Kapaibacterium sp.]|nr:MAG: FAA hydrolase family protein [Candidatus Kapabacteria bacterium]
MPVGTIYGIGKNYAAHAREMGGEVPASPMVFIKPPAAFVNAAPSDNAQTPHLSLTNNLHYEVELVVVIGSDCRNLPKSEAASVIAGYAVGLDMTLRDLQSEAKTSGSPWAVAKGYAGSAPCSQIIPADDLAQYPEFQLELYVNDTLRQQGSTRQMERDVATLIAYLSTVFTLRKGDCIFTGTPEGVGRVVAGDRIYARLSHPEMTSLDLSVVVVVSHFDKTV